MKESTTSNPSTATFSMVGMAAMLPGMQHMLTLMQEELERMRQLIGGAAGPQVKHKGRPPGTPDKQVRASPWTDMTARERSEEMQRRILVRRGLAPPRGRKSQAKAAPVETGKMHVRDSRHPGHAAWVAKLKKMQKARWESLTVRQQREQQAKMQAGKKPKPKVKMAHPVAALAPNGKVAHA